MAEEKSAPKKEKAVKAATVPVEGAPKAGAVAEGKPARAPKGAADGSGAPAAAPAAEKPVEMIGGVAKQPTAEDLLKEELGTIKVRKAKGSKNVTSGLVNVLASFNNT